MNLKNASSKFSRFVRDLESAHAVHVFDGTLGHASLKVDLAPAFEKARKLLKL